MIRKQQQIDFRNRQIGLTFFSTSFQHEGLGSGGHPNLSDPQRTYAKKT